MEVSPLAGKHPKAAMLADITKLVAAYFSEVPDPAIAEQRIAFGTSGHRGSSLEKSFNEHHILAITLAICLFRERQQINGPLFLGIDTHALSVPALQSALQVLAANGVDVMLAEGDEFTPTPAISHAILTYNRGRTARLADGIVITPSHNPPTEGGFKYNPPNGGPADQKITSWIEAKGNEILENKLAAVKRVSYEKACAAPTTHRHNYLQAYVEDLINVVDMEAIKRSEITLGVDPLGGAGVHYWRAIKERYGIDLDVVNETVDPTFSFMTMDWDGKIRMDPSSPYAMQALIGLKDRFDIAFACDTDHDRHGIVTKSSGLLPPNHYLSTAIHYLFQHRPRWRPDLAIGKTVVSSQMIDRVASDLEKRLYEVPVGFKWFAEGLHDGTLGFVGEESAGASFLRFDGTVWTTDKDGIILALLAAEITAKTGRDPGQLYEGLTRQFGKPYYDRIDAPATPKQKELLKKLSPQQISSSTLAGEPILSTLTEAPGNGAPIGGVKVVAENGWFAARPSGTENLYKIYAESFRSQSHLDEIIQEAQGIVSQALGEESHDHTNTRLN